MLISEATLRLLVENEGLTLPKPGSPPNLLKLLVTQGVISQTDYQSLINNFELRNAIAHGFKTHPLNPNSLTELINMTENLLESLNTI
ncbi:MAG: hypothetical protein F6K62_18295 [Sphaerospermopsis sp. SIO1G2]|nr:hypothetical protein [Sphaerospermopsis sp. SIO1G1]NET72803.1 hypothetical protein [Sphaerospermopsis sp. SIO1G2]